MKNSSIDRRGVQPSPPIRDAPWLMRCSVAVVLLIVVSVIGCEYCALLGAERVLATAAREGAQEAGLPSASTASVRAAISRSLARYPWSSQVKILPIAINGELIQRRWRAHPGDRYTVSLEVPHAAVTRNLIAKLSWFCDGRPLAVSATHTTKQVGSRSL